MGVFSCIPGLFDIFAYKSPPDLPREMVPYELNLPPPVLCGVGGVLKLELFGPPHVPEELNSSRREITPFVPE